MSAEVPSGNGNHSAAPVLCPVTWAQVLPCLMWPTVFAATDITFTVYGQDLNRHKELDAKVRDEWKMVYNPELFLSVLLRDGWEAGIVATLDPHEKRAIRQTEQYVLGAF